MKLTRWLLFSLLITAVCFTACESEPPITETVPPETTIAADPFEAVRSSGEEWLIHGLAAYESGTEAPDLKDFFAVSSNLTYLTLYDHFFTYDAKASIPVAQALFRFILDEYGIDALLDTDRRIEYKNAYLQSLGLQPTYIQTPEVEALLSSMEFSSDDTHPYIIAFDHVTYYFKDFGAGSPTQYHGLLYFTTTGLYEMMDYLRENNLTEGLDTDRDFHFYMTFDGSALSRTVYPSGDIYINEAASTLHEAMHAMGIRNSNHVWLSEGICNYFGRALGFNNQISATHIQLLTMAKQGAFDARAAAGEQYAQLYKMIYEQYNAAGGDLAHADSFDLRLYSDITARMELDTFRNTTLGEAYEKVNKTACTSVGRELTYEQSTSLVTYLADVYGIETVLAAYHSQDIAGSFGKDYDALKADWIAYLYES